MAFLFLLLYQCIFLLRPFEWSSTYVEDEGAFPYTALCLVISLGFMFSNRAEKVFSTQFWLSCILCVVIVFSAISNSWLGGAVGQLQAFILVAVIPVLLYSNIANSSKRIEIIMFAFLSAAMIMLSNGISQKLAPDGIGWAGSLISQGTRITYLGVLEDPNDLGGFLVMCLPFAAYFSIHSRAFLLRLFGKLTVLGLFYGVYLTNSRGALLATFAIIGSYILYRYGKARSFIIGLIGLPVLFIVLSLFRSIDAEEESASDRVDAWYAGFEMLFSQPLFGVGFGNFTDHHNLTAHNSFVLIMSELGLVGYAFWFSMMGLSFYMLYKMLALYSEFQKGEHDDTPENIELKRILAINCAFFFSMTGYATTAFFLSRSYHFLTYFLCAIAVALYQQIITLQPEYKFQNISSEIRKLILLSFASIFGLMVIVKIAI